MASNRSALAGAILVAASQLAWSTEASANAYDVVLVSVDRLSEQFVPDLQGVIAGTVTSSNLPGPFMGQTSGSYTQVSPTAIGGTWGVSDGGVNAIGGTFQMQNRSFSPGLAPTSGTVTLDPGSSKGTFLGATGGGTFEAYTRDVFDPLSSQFYTQRVTVTRLQFQADGPAQTDLRPVTVSSRVAVNDNNTSHGVNIGVPTSDSLPMVITNVRSEYDYSTPPTHGESFTRNNSGDSTHWSFVVDPNSGQDMGGFLSHFVGTATMLGGTGVFAGKHGFSDWESFEVGTGQLAPNVFSAALVTVDRYTIGAVPEPQTYAMLIAGLTAVGAMTMRRRKVA